MSPLVARNAAGTVVIYVAVTAAFLATTRTHASSQAGKDQLNEASRPSSTPLRKAPPRKHHNASSVARGLFDVVGRATLGDGRMGAKVPGFLA